MAQPFHREVPVLNRYLGSLIYIMQNAFPGSEFWENIRRKNVRSIIGKIKRKVDAGKFKPGRVLQIDRVGNISEREFKDKYLRKNLPVVFDGGAKDWPCTKKWSVDYLEKFLGNEKIIFIDTVGLTEKEFDNSNTGAEAVITDEMTAAEFARSLRNGSRKYLRFSLFMESREDFKNDLDHPWLSRMRNGFLQPGYQTFIGPAARVTPIHAASTAFFYIMADGEKKWTLFSANSSALIKPVVGGRNYNMSDVKINDPDLKRYPGFDLISRYEIHLKKGDILFVPGYMWHEVENLTISWACNYRFTSLDEYVRYPAFLLVRMFFAKPSILRSFVEKYVFHTKSIAKVE